MSDVVCRVLYAWSWLCVKIRVTSLLGVLLMLAVMPGMAQDQSDPLTDSTAIVADSLADEINTDETRDNIALPDSAEVNKRDFAADKIRGLKNDPDLRYHEPASLAESLWNRILRWLGDLLASLFDNGIDTRAARLVLILLGVLITVVVIMTLLRVNAFRLFYGREAASTFEHNVLDENIHEMDFDKLVQEARARGDFRGGVRLVFLHALKILSDKQHIHWQRGKTNHDYLAELTQTDLKPGFDTLNYYFEYAWYGNFAVDGSMFEAVQGTFNDWKRKVS